MLTKQPITLLGRFIYMVFPYRRKVIMKNIEQVFTNGTSTENKKNLAKAFYSHLAKCFKETLQIRFISDKKLRKKVTVVGQEHLLSVADQGKGVLILTGHFGNWEFAPLGGILNFAQYKGHFHFIRKNIRNKFVERILFKRYIQAGLHVIPKDNAMHLVKDALEKNHAVIFVLDQHAIIQNKDGIPVEFFGKKAGTYRSLASLSRHTGIPVIPAASYRKQNGQHVLEFFKPIPWQEFPTTSESLYQNTLNYNRALEKIILQNPAQWMWLHKRWKLDKFYD